MPTLQHIKAAGKRIFCPVTAKAFAEGNVLVNTPAMTHITPSTFSPGKKDDVNARVTSPKSVKGA